jgi:ketosteroid isomerase-like protein
MTARETVARYYEAWQTGHGDLSAVPLADDFQFTGPVASFDSADGYRAMAREAGQAVTSFHVRRQFVDGNSVCSIVDWEMSIPGTGRMTAAELLEVEDGVIVRGELIYDAEELRRAMGRGDATAGVGPDG